MIRDAEVRRFAAVAGVEPRIVELDYVHFADYRFSEDLDFTSVRAFDGTVLEEAVGEALADVGGASGIDFAAEESKHRIIDAEYGRETLRFTAYWRGPHVRTGSPRGLRLDVTRHEIVVDEPVRRAVLHPFSDAADLGTVELPCYTLEEVMAEKVRAILGQRIYAVSRDLYDIFVLRGHVDVDRTVECLPKKLAIRDVDASAIDMRRITERKAEFEADWHRNLVGLLPPGADVNFDDVWPAVVAYASQLAERSGFEDRGGEA